MSLKCILKHDWQVLQSDTAINMCSKYLCSLEHRPFLNTNFINCPDHIEFEDKVCLRCEEVRMHYTRIKEKLPDLFEKYQKALELDAKRVEEKRREINANEEERVRLAKEILEKSKGTK